MIKYLHYQQYKPSEFRMSKSGMDFFKNAASKGSSLFGGMKVKGPSAAQKPKVAQTETNLSTYTQDVSHSNSQQQKNKPTQDQQKVEQRVQDVSSKQSRKQSVDDEVKYEEAAGSFEMPPLAKKPQPVKSKTVAQSQSYQSNVKPEPKIQQTLSSQTSKKSSSSNQISDNRHEETSDTKPASEQVDELNATVDSPPFRKDSDRKESASDSNYVFDKKKRKESNPFISQIKKTAPTSKGDPEPEQLKKQSLATQLRMPKRSQKQLLLQQINQHHIKTIEFIIKQKQLKQSIIQIASSLQQHRDELSEAIQQQCSCVQRQEYEEADNYQNKIQNLQKKIQQQESELTRRQEEFYRNEYENLKNEKNQNYENKKLVRRIKLVELQLLEDSSNIRRKKAEWEQNQNQKIENENKKMTRLQNDIKFQSEQLVDFERKYQEDLNSRRDPLHEELNQQQNSKAKLEDEIAQLERRLAVKKGELKDVNSRIGSLKKEIKQVEQAFKQQGVKLGQRKKKLQKLEQQKDNIFNHVRQMEQAKIKQMQQMNRKSEESEKQAAVIAEMAIQIQQNSFNFQDKMQQRKTKVDTFIHNTKQLKQFQHKHKQKRNKIKQLQFKKSNTVGEANSLQQKRTQLKAKIPKLEQEQKQLVDAKNFKGAGMKKTQIKQTLETIQTISKKIEQCFVKQKQIEEQIGSMNQEQNEYISEQNEIKKNLAISQFRFDVSKWEQLVEESEWTAKLGSEMKGKYLQVLQEEIENLIEEIKYIGEQYGLDIGFLDAPKDKSKSKQQQPYKTKAVQTKDTKKVAQTKTQSPQPKPAQVPEQPEQHQQQYAPLEIPTYEPAPVDESVPAQKPEQQEDKPKEPQSQHQQEATPVEQPRKQQQHEQEHHDVEVEAQQPHHAQEQQEQEVGYVPLQLDD